MGVGLRPCRWTFFYRLSQPPSCCQLIFISGQYCPIYRRVLEHKVKQKEKLSANSTGAIWNTQLILLGCIALCAYRQSRAHSPHLQAKRGAFAAPIIIFCGFVVFAALRLLAKYESQHQWYWPSIKNTKDQAKCRDQLAAIRLLLQNLTIKMCVQYEAMIN